MIPIRSEKIDEIDRRLLPQEFANDLIRSISAAGPYALRK